VLCLVSEHFCTPRRCKVAKAPAYRNTRSNYSGRLVKNVFCNKYFLYLFQCRKNKSPHRNRNPLFSDPATPIYLQMIEYQASGLSHCPTSSCVPFSPNRTSKLGFESTDCQYLEYSCSMNALPLQKAARLVNERTARDPCPFAHH